MCSHICPQRQISLLERVEPVSMGNSVVSSPIDQLDSCSCNQLHGDRILFKVRCTFIMSSPASTYSVAVEGQKWVKPGKKMV